ncbi:MAG: branched-chain amino acid transport system II carrier protein [Streptococcus thermophilus]
MVSELPFLTLVIGTLNPKGYIHEISQKISPKFALAILGSALPVHWTILCHSKDGSSSLSIGIRPMLGNGHTSLWLLAFTAVYFALALYGLP